MEVVITEGPEAAAETRVDNAQFFGDDVSQVPRHVLTQGIGEDEARS